MILNAAWISCDDEKVENGKWHKWMNEKFVFITACSTLLANYFVNYFTNTTSGQ